MSYKDQSADVFELAREIKEGGHRESTVGELVGHTESDDVPVQISSMNITPRTKEYLSELGAETRDEVRGLRVESLPDAYGFGLGSLREILRIAASDSAKGFRPLSSQLISKKLVRAAVAGALDAETIGSLSGNNLLDDEDALVYQFDITTRLQNILYRSGVATLNELRRLPIRQLRLTQGVGAESIREALSLAATAGLGEGAQLLGSDLVQAAMAEDPQVLVLPEALDRFVAETERTRFCRNVEQHVAPEEMDRPARMFLRMWAIAKPKQSAAWREHVSAVPSALTLRGYLEAVGGYSTPFAEAFREEAGAFIDWLCMNPAEVLHACIEDWRESLPATEELAEIAEHRGRGESLRQIGESMHTTSGRIEQLSEQAGTHFFDSNRATFVSAMARTAARLGDGGGWVTNRDFAELLGDDAYTLLGLLYSARSQTAVVPIPAYHALWVSDQLLPDFPSLHSLAETIVFSLPAVLPRDTAGRYVTQQARKMKVPEKFLKQIFVDEYTRGKQIWYRSKGKISVLADHILKYYFPCGLDVGNDADLDRFNRTAASIAGEDVKFPARTMPRLIASLGTGCGPKTYAHNDYMRITQRGLDQIRSYIDSQDSDAVSIDAIFRDLEENLRPFGITSPRVLRGILLHHGIPCPLTWTDVIKGTDTSFDAPVLEFVAGSGGASMEEIREEFPELTTDAFTAIAASVGIAEGDDEIFRTTDALDIEDADLEKLWNIASDMRWYSSTALSAVRGAIEEALPGVLERVHATTADSLASLLQMIAPREPHRTGQAAQASQLGLTGSPAEMREAVLDMLGHPRQFLLSDAEYAATQLGIPHDAREHGLWDFVPEYYPADNDLFVRADALGITDEVRQRVLRVIAREADDEGHVDAQTVAEAGGLPKIARPWTPELITAVAAENPDVIQVEFLDDEHLPAELVVL